MGTLVGHVLPGMAFFIIGMWHLFNHTKLHARNPNSYVSLLWFPTAASRYLELYLIMLAAATFISMELFVMPHRHHPFDTDGTIPSNHLHNIEHANIAVSIFSYGFLAFVLDRLNPPAKKGLTHMLAVVLLAHELLLFNLHSTDHVGLEGQYHWLLQLVLLTSVATTIASVKYSRSFLLSFTRSLTVVAQGVWLVVSGYMLYIPRLIPKGCMLVTEDGGHRVVECEEGWAVARAKSLANILFSYYVVGMSVLGVVAYLVVYRMYCHEKTGKDGESTESDEEEMKGFLQSEKGFAVLKCKGNTGVCAQ